ncbi:MAG: extracellular solute-binding protein, partial [Candidatus Ornithomonoglobus sp.]
MKHGKSFKLICLMSAGILAASALSGCGTGGSEKGEAPTELKIMMSGSKPNYFDEVLEEFYNRTKDTLNVRLNIEWSPQADHKEKLLLRMTAGEEFDLVFDAPFLNFRTLSANGAYADLESYYNNPDYPGLQAMFSSDYIDANRVNGKIYCIPFTSSYGQFTTDSVILRGDLRKKYNLPEVKTREDYQLYLDTILANEPDTIPLCINAGRGFYHLLDSDEMVYRHKKNMYLVSAGVLWEVAISDDNKKVLGVSYYGDPAEYRTGFPEGYKEVDYSAFERQRDWRKYIEKDSINQKDEKSVFYGGKAASILASASEFSSIEQRVKNSVPDAELEVFPYYKPTQQLEEGGWATTYAAWNYLCVPKTSKHIDKAMEFIDWIFSDKANHDLFEYGIEGKHWTAVGDDGYDYADGINADNSYNFPAYEL